MSRKRKAGRGPCTYCGRVHHGGKKRGDSCGGHGVRRQEGAAVAKVDGPAIKRKPPKGIARARKVAGREAAEARLATRDALSRAEKLKALDTRPGNSARERARLAKENP